MPRSLPTQIPTSKSTGLVTTSLWRVVLRLMNAEIERDTQLYVLLVTAKEAGQAILDIAEHNDRLRILFKSLYGISIKEYINKCLSEKRGNTDMNPAFAEYECWYSLLLRVFLILRQPTQKQLEEEQRELDMMQAQQFADTEESEEIGEE